jgi:hypothetical protein
MCAKVAAFVRAGSMPSDEREGRERGERKVESETYSLRVQDIPEGEEVKRRKRREIKRLMSGMQWLR